MDTGLLSARLVLGLLMAAHGSQKLFGWFGGGGLTATASYFEQIGFRPGRRFVRTAAAAEVVGGLLLAAGFLGPIGPALMFSVMIVAAISVHWQNGVFAMKNGIEVPLLYATGAATLALTGPGRFSIDALLGWTSGWSPAAAWAALILGTAGALVGLATRNPTVPPARA